MKICKIGSRKRLILLTSYFPSIGNLFAFWRSLHESPWTANVPVHSFHHKQHWWLFICQFLTGKWGLHLLIAISIIHSAVIPQWIQLTFFLLNNKKYCDILYSQKCMIMVTKSKLVKFCLISKTSLLFLSEQFVIWFLLCE